MSLWLMESFTEKTSLWTRSKGGVMLKEHPGEVCMTKWMPGMEPGRQGWADGLDNIFKAVGVHEMDVK